MGYGKRKTVHAVKPENSILFSRIFIKTILCRKTKSKPQKKKPCTNGLWSKIANLCQKTISKPHKKKLFTNGVWYKIVILCRKTKYELHNRQIAILLVKLAFFREKLAILSLNMFV